MKKKQKADTKSVYESEIVLGKRYRDKITGIEGVAVMVTFHLHACEQASLEYVLEGKPAFFTADVARFVDVETEQELKLKDKAATGGTARPVASRHR